MGVVAHCSGSFCWSHVSSGGRLGCRCHPQMKQRLPEAEKGVSKGGFFHGLDKVPTESAPFSHRLFTSGIPLGAFQFAGAQGGAPPCKSCRCARPRGSKEESPRW